MYEMILKIQEIGFNPLHEQLAFKLVDNEYDLDGIWAKPLDVVVDALKKNGYYCEMVENFPDILKIE